MSHFTVLVPADNDEELEKILLRYHEYECTGIEEYVEFVPADMQDVLADFEGQDKYDDFDFFAKSYYGYVKKDGVWGVYTNPNAKWDWWVIGGRWTGLLRLKEPNTGRNGKPGLMTDPNRDPYAADVAMKKDIDFEGIEQTRFTNLLASWRKRKAYLDRAKELDWDADKEIAAKIPEFKNGYRQKEKYASEYGVTEEMFLTDKIGYLLSWRDYKAEIIESPVDMGWTWSDIHNNSLTEEAYKEQIGKRTAMTYAFLDKQGNWYQRGEMGWFGMDDPDKGTQDYDEMWWRLIDSLDDDQLIYIVDCHI